VLVAVGWSSTRIPLTSSAGLKGRNGPWPSATFDFGLALTPEQAQQIPEIIEIRGGSGEVPTRVLGRSALAMAVAGMRGCHAVPAAGPWNFRRMRQVDLAHLLTGVENGSSAVAMVARQADGARLLLVPLGGCTVAVVWSTRFARVRWLVDAPALSGYATRCAPASAEPQNAGHGRAEHRTPDPT
jgi:hypothetical protein